MKAIVFLLVSLISSFSFAGPEEHKDDSAFCYRLSTPAPQFIPGTVCLKGWYANKTSVEIDSYTHADFFKNLTVDSVKQYDKEISLVTASNVYFENNSTDCAKPVTAKTIVRFYVNNKGESTLQEVGLQYTNCHQSPETVFYQYR